MSFPWYLKPDLFLHAEMLDKQEALESAANSSYATDQRQDKEIQSLKKRVTELENQLLALEKILSEHGILPPMPPEPETPPPDAPARFPSRTLETVACLGACGLAPVVTVNDQVHSKMSPELAIDLLESLRKEEAAHEHS